jgi:hypothetical protein
MTQRQIASDVGLSQMHVSRLITPTLERLRRESEDGRAEATEVEAVLPHA